MLRENPFKDWPHSVFCESAQFNATNSMKTKRFISYITWIHTFRLILCTRWRCPKQSDNRNEIIFLNSSKLGVWGPNRDKIFWCSSLSTKLFPLRRGRKRRKRRKKFFPLVLRMRRMIIKLKHLGEIDFIFKTNLRCESVARWALLKQKN